MAETLGALATVVFVDTVREVIWVRFPNGNAMYLDQGDDPDVEVGTVVLVSLDGDSFIEAPSEVFPQDPVAGVLATVVIATPGESYWVRYSGGAYGPLHHDAGPEVAAGDSILVSGHTFTLVPESLAPPPRNGIGVVRRVEDQRSLVETNHAMSWLPHDGAVDWKEWSTVEISEAGIVKELHDRPVRAGDDPPSAFTVRSRFRLDPEGVTETFESISGLDEQIRELREIIALMDDADTLAKNGIRPVRGVLFAGASGTGKTMLARALANEANAAFFHVRGPEIASKWVNESEEMLRALMDEADSLERAVVFFDEIDSLGGERSSEAHEMSNKLITQFLTLLDGFDQKTTRALVVGATNRPEALDPTMLRSGRFDRRITFELPNSEARQSILEATMPRDLVEQINTAELAVMTGGWSSSDLAGLWSDAHQFAKSERRVRILHLDCEVAVGRGGSRVLARRTQIGRAK